MSPNALATILLTLDSYSVEQVGAVYHHPASPGGTRPESVTIHLPDPADWLRLVDHAFDLDAGQLPTGSASLSGDTLFCHLQMDGFMVLSGFPLALIGDVEDVLHLMGVKELEAWKALAEVAA